MKLAFIGTGKIINDALFAVSTIKSIEKTAIFARPHSKEKGKKIAADNGIIEVYTDYDKLLEESDADAVYIGLINSAHYEYAKRAVLKGKHVILEKPLTGFADEAKELRELANKNDVFVLEAVTVLHNGVIDEMKKNAAKLGKIKMFLANYSQYSSAYDAYLAGNPSHAFLKEYYGGALYDIDVYNIHYCVSLFGEPTAVQYYPNFGYNGIDVSGTLVMQYDGFSAVCTCAKDSDSPGYVSVQGEKGYMHLAGKPNTADTLNTVYLDETKSATGERDAAGSIIRPQVKLQYTAEKYPHRMTQEFTDFAEIIDKHLSEKAAALMDESVAVVNTLERARLSAGIEFTR